MPYFWTNTIWYLLLDPFVSTILNINLVFVLFAAAIMPVYYLKLKWRWKTAVMAALLGVIYFDYKLLHLLWFQNDGWPLVFSVVS